MVGEKLKKAKEAGIPFAYLLERGMVNINDILRGQSKRFFLKECGKKFRCGKHSKLRPGKYIKIGNNVKLGEYTQIDALFMEDCIIGDGVHLGERCTIMGGGIARRMGFIKIGDGSSFGGGCFFGAKGGIAIGNNTFGGQNIRFHSANHKYSDINCLIKDQGETFQGIVVGSNCWIGAGAVFLDGTVVGDGCVIGANAVLRGSYPNNSVIVGCPAKVVKFRSDKEEKKESDNE